MRTMKTLMNRALPSLLSLLATSLAGCVEPPEPVRPMVPIDGSTGVLVVNEGVWGQDNGTLTYHDPASNVTIDDYFTVHNTGLRLGDVPNAITIAHGHAYVAVTGSRTVEVMRLPGVRSTGRVRLHGPSQPRELAIVDSTLGCVTVLSDSVIFFDPFSFRVTGGVKVGPAPDGIVAMGGRLFVANSGYGLFRQHEPKAGTISVIDIATRSEIASIEIGPNPRTVARLGQRLYAAYGLADSAGGVVEIDPFSMRETRRWPARNVIDMAIDLRGGRVMIVADSGVVAIDPLHPDTPPRTLVHLREYPDAIFYAVGVAPVDGEILVARTEGYLPRPAEVLRFDPEGRYIGTFRCGVYPGDFGFY